jgi:hypothetical protein
VLKDWIFVHVPRHEDGNNFGVEVQEQALNELGAIIDESNGIIEEQASYHLARANIMEKIAQEGNIDDLKGNFFILNSPLRKFWRESKL